MDNQGMLNRFDALPPNLKQQVLDFIDFLLQKSSAKPVKKTPQFGILKGKIRMSDDFDEPLEDFKDYM